MEPSSFGLCQIFCPGNTATLLLWAARTENVLSKTERTEETREEREEPVDVPMSSLPKTETSSSNMD